MILWVGFCVVGILTLFLYSWAHHRMKTVIKTLFEVSQSAQDRLKEIQMGCNCKEKTTKDMTVPCGDPKEESFRVAFMNETKKAARLSAEKIEFQRRLEIYEKVSFETVRKLDLHIQSLEHYAKMAVQALPAPMNIEFVKNYGHPPTSLRIGNGS